MNSKIREILGMMVIGFLVGVLVFKLFAEGKIPSQLSPVTQTRVVVSEENSVISTVDSASPSVVAIGVTQNVVNPFDPFAAPTQQQNTIGTGFAVSDGSIIVTNKHVVSDLGVSYAVVTKDGKKLNVSKIYRDPTFDLALIKVTDSNLKALDLGDSTKLKVGQTAIAIGNALGRFDNTVTTGVVSGLGRTVDAGDPYSTQTETLDNLIQTDAAINPGNSGGPLLNSNAQVIGVNVAETQGAQNIGFAIPINQVKSLIDQFQKTGTVSKPFLGIQYQYLTRDLALLDNLPQGAYVRDVVAGSPAEKAGIKSGDVIVKINGKNIDSEGVISTEINSKKVGDSVSLDIYSNGSTKSLTVSLVENPNQ